MRPFEPCRVGQFFGAFSKFLGVARQERGQPFFVCLFLQLWEGPTFDRAEVEDGGHSAGGAEGGLPLAGGGDQAGAVVLGVGGRLGAEEFGLPCLSQATSIF